MIQLIYLFDESLVLIPVYFFQVSDRLPIEVTEPYAIRLLNFPQAPMSDTRHGYG